MSATTSTAPAQNPAWISELRSYVGKRYGKIHAWDAVNEPMIRQWCEAIDFDFAPFNDAAAAKATRHGGIVAPASMLPVWLMPGIKNARPAGSDLANPREIMNVLEREGYLGIMATNCEQEYERYLKPGDKISSTSMVESISDEKQTKFGPGFFVNFLTEYFDEKDQLVGRMRLRILRFRPKKAGEKKKRPAPPQPVLMPDTAFFWEGVKAGKLLIQRCASCHKLRHPPGPVCTSCHSLEWDTVQSSGRGILFSFVVMHKPMHEAFDAPHPVGLIELEEGTRLVAPLTEVDIPKLEIGMPMEAVFNVPEGEYRLPSFRPVKKS